MPDTYKNSQSEDNDAARARRLKIKKKKNAAVVGGIIGGKAQFGVGGAPVRRGLKNPLLLLKKREAEEKEKERKRNLKYQKQDKINRNKS